MNGNKNVFPYIHNYKTLTNSKNYVDLYNCKSLKYA